MAITAVPPNQVVPAFAVRESVLLTNTQREQALATPPSAITRISSEGRLRAELERKQIVPAPPNEAFSPADNRAQADVSTAQVAVTASRPSENAAAGTLQPAVPERGNRNTAPAASVSTSPATPPAAPPSVPALAPAPEIATPVRRSPSDVINQVSIASRLVENAADRIVGAAEQQVVPLQISQTANEFVAAFNAVQNQRNANLDRSAATSTTRTVNVAELRVAPSTAPNPEAVPVLRAQASTVQGPQFDRSTFSAGVARNSEALRQIPSNPPANASLDESNDTRRIVQAEVAPDTPLAGARAGASTGLNPASDPAQPQAAEARARAQIEQEARLAGFRPQPSGLAQHLNDLANRLTR